MKTIWAGLAFILVLACLYQMAPGTSGFVRDKRAQFGVSFISFPAFPCRDMNETIGSCLAREGEQEGILDFFSIPTIMLYSDRSVVDALADRLEGNVDYVLHAAALRASTGKFAEAVDLIKKAPYAGKGSLHFHLLGQVRVVEALISSGKLENAAEFAAASQDFLLEGPIEEGKSKNPGAWNPMVMVIAAFLVEKRNAEAEAFVAKIKPKSVFLIGTSRGEVFSFAKEHADTIILASDSRDVNSSVAKKPIQKLESADASEVAFTKLASIAKSKDISLAASLWVEAMDNCMKRETKHLSDNSPFLHDYPQCMACLYIKTHLYNPVYN